MVAPSILTSLVDVSDKVPGPCRFLFKNELHQPSGSFKLRGMSALVDHSIKEAKEQGKLDIHIYTSSGGNAGLAAAYASRFHGIPCTVVLPVLTKQVAIDKLLEYQANVVLQGAHWGEADLYLKNTLMAQVPTLVSAIYCHPFDNEILWDGHGDIVDEIAKQLTEMDVHPEKVKGVVCSAGGGGLYCGIVAGLKRNKNLSKVPVLVVETHQAPTFDEAVKAGKVVTLAKVETIASSLGAPFLAEKALLNYNLHPTKLGIMDDMDAVKGAIDYFDGFGELVEPACGATVAVAFEKKELLQAFGKLEKDEVVILVVCGGSTLTAQALEAFREQF